jgi:hypothetical protein
MVLDEWVCNRIRWASPTERFLVRTKEVEEFRHVCCIVQFPEMRYIFTPLDNSVEVEA